MFTEPVLLLIDSATRLSGLAKYLAVILDTKLTWRGHVKQNIIKIFCFLSGYIVGPSARPRP
jgi:hypothetical protein